MFISQFSHITVLSTHFPSTLGICLCQLFPFLSLLHIYRVPSPILFILACYCLLVHFDNKMPLRIPLGLSLPFMPIGFHLRVLFQDLCIFSGESSHLWLWFLKALGMYVTISHWFYSQFKGLKLCLIPIPSLGAMTSSPWYSEIIPSGPVFSSQTLLKKSVISFRVDGTQCALHAFSDLFSMSFFLFFQLCNYTFFLSLSTSVTIKLFWIWGEVWSVEDLFWNACLNCFLP